MDPRNPYENRWRWWYEAIADRMIAHPEWRQEDIARDLNRHANTISYIMRTDLFRDYLARRKADFREMHDLGIVARSTKIAERGLDVILDVIEKKKDQIPLQLLDKITTSALDRLGYGAPVVAVDARTQIVDASRNVNVNVTPQLIEEARMAVRTVESMRMNGMSSLPSGRVEPSATVETPGRDGSSSASEEEKEEGVHAPVLLES